MFSLYPIGRAMKFIILLCYVSLSIAFSHIIGMHQELNNDARHVNTIIISSDYTVTADDFMIIVKQSGSKIVLPDHLKSKGRLVAIKNISEGDILAIGTIVGNHNTIRRNDNHISECMIHPNQSLLFRSDGKQWMRFETTK